MQSALFVVAIPPTNDPTNTWIRFAQFVDGKLAPHAKSIVRLAENVWFLRLHETVAPLGWLIVQAENLGIGYGVLPFEHEPEWFPGGFDPKTIQGRSE